MKSSLVILIEKQIKGHRTNPAYKGSKVDKAIYCRITQILEGRYSITLLGTSKGAYLYETSQLQVFWQYILDHIIPKVQRN